MVVQQIVLESIHNRSSLECPKERFGSSFHSVTMYMSEGLDTWKSLFTNLQGEAAIYTWNDFLLL